MHDRRVQELQTGVVMLDAVGNPTRSVACCLSLLALASTLAVWSGCDGGGDTPEPECPDEPILGESPVACIDWEAVAEERGFDPRPDDFFAFMQLGCVVEPIVATSTLGELVDYSDSIFFGHFLEVVPVSEGLVATVPEYATYLRIAVDEMVTGTSPGEIEVIPNCGTTGKVAGLQYSLPDDTYLFFLRAGETSEVEGLYFFSHFYLGVAEQTSTGPQFALQADAEITPPPLDEYESLDELAEAVRDL